MKNNVVCTECGINQTYSDLKIEYFGPVPIKWCGHCVCSNSLVDTDTKKPVNNPNVIKIMERG